VLDEAKCLEKVRKKRLKERDGFSMLLRRILPGIPARISSVEKVPHGTIER
jgi:hypothetical protein